MKHIFFLALVVLSNNYVNPAKILTINTLNFPSHSAWLAALASELGKHRHEVTFVDFSPSKKHIPNSEILIIEPFPPDVNEYEERFGATLLAGTSIQKVDALMESELKKCEKFYDIAPFKLLASPDYNKTFDLILINYNLQDCLLGLAYRFDAPLVLVAPFTTNPHWLYRAMRTPLYHAVPHPFDDFTTPLSTFQRLRTLVTYLYDDVHYHWKFVPKIDETLRRTFGKDAPGVSDLMDAVVLALVNIPASKYDIPLPANVIPVGGLHITPPKVLPQDLREFLDNAKEGAILMSFGSIVRGDSLAPDKRAAILKVFSKIPQRVLWKWESAGKGDDHIVPKNVQLRSWLPQNDILAHPNIRLFISHCGGMSSIESAYHGVPILAMPFFLDQLVQADRVVREGRGLRLRVDDVTEESFSKALTDLLNNPKYREAARTSKIIYQEQPVHPLDKSVFWIEFAARNRHAIRTTCPLTDLSWIPLLYFDYVLLFSLVITAFLIFFYSLLFAARTLKRQLFASNPKSKTKINSQENQSKKNK